MADMPSLNLNSLGSTRESSSDKENPTAENNDIPAPARLSLKKQDDTLLQAQNVHYNSDNPSQKAAEEAVEEVVAEPTPVAPSLAPPKKKSKLSLAKPTVTASPQISDPHGDAEAPQQYSNPLFSDNQNAAEAPISENTDCPQCHTAVSSEAVLCTNCGYNFKAGKQQRTIVKKAVKSQNDGLKNTLGLVSIILGWLCLIPAAGSLFFIAPLFMEQESTPIVDKLIASSPFIMGCIFYILLGKSHKDGGRWLREESNTPLQLWAILLRVSAWFFGWICLLFTMGIASLVVVAEVYKGDHKHLKVNFSLYDQDTIIMMGVSFAILLGLHLGLKAISRPHLYHPNAE